MYVKLRKISSILLILAIVSIAIDPVYAKEKAKIHKKASSKVVQEETSEEIKALKAELFIAAQEDKAIAQAQKLLRKYKGTTLEADLHMRLGELYLRRAKTDRFLEVNRNSDVIVSIVPKIVRNAKSKTQVLKAISEFDLIEAKFKDFDKIDAVVFNNGFANQQIGNNKKAEQKYKKLIDLYNYSILMPDAHLALGEMQFNRQSFDNALSHFQAIRKFPDSQVYPYGIYKAGWSYYNLRRNDLALKELEDVVKYGRFVREQGIDARLDLRKEALIDMTLFYEDLRPSKEAYSYFQDQAGELDVSPVILRLTELYKRHSRFKDVKVVLADYIKRHPTSLYVPRAYMELMDSSEKLQKRDDVVILLGSFSELCEKDSKWVRAQKAEDLTSAENPLMKISEVVKGMEGHVPTPDAQCNLAFRKVALGYANQWLKIWTKDETKPELAEATEKAFALFLAKDSVSAESFKARFVYADLLFKRKKYREASENYAIASEGSKDRNIQHDARYYAILALEKAVQDKWSDDDEKKLNILSSRYLKNYANGKFALDVEFKSAFVAYEKGRYDEAGVTFKKLGENHKNTDKGLKAQDLYLDTLNIKKDYKALRQYSASLKVSAKGERLGKLNKIYEESYFLIVQNLEEKGKYKEAIQEYSSFATTNPKSKLTQKALWNITQLHYRLGDLMGAANSSEVYGDTYSGAKEGVDAYMKAAQTYESLAQLKEAAQVLLKLSGVDGANQEKWSLLAADFLQLSGEFRRAKPHYANLRKSKASDVSFRALQQLQLIAKAEGDEKTNRVLLNEIADSNRQPFASEAAVFFIEETYAKGQVEDAFNASKKVIGQAKSGASKNALARARFIQALVLQQEFYKQSLKSQLERVQLVLTLKTEKLAKVQSAFQDAARYGDPQISVKAFSELANCYLHYSNSVMSMPLPKGLPETEAAAFQQQMNQFAIPMEEKGIEAKIQALAVARELGVQGPIVEELHAEMKKLNQQVAEKSNIVTLEPAEPVLPMSSGVES